MCFGFSLSGSTPYYTRFVGGLIYIIICDIDYIFFNRKLYAKYSYLWTRTKIHPETIRLPPSITYPQLIYINQLTPSRGKASQTDTVC
jgi:hypothetical protein